MTQAARIAQLSAGTGVHCGDALDAGREAANIQEGDILAFDLDGNNRIIIKRVDPSVDVELSALQGTLSEWASPEDEEAWRDL